MRVIKQRLIEMVPGFSIFLDVDDLKEGAGAMIIDETNVVLTFLTTGYFVRCVQICLHVSECAANRYICMHPSVNTEKANLCCQN